MVEMKNTYYEFTFEDGEKCQMTLAYYFLYQLKGKKKDIYDRYNALMTKGVKEEIEMITILYAAYLCANLDNLSDCMSEVEFMIKCGSDRFAVKTAFERLTKAKK